MSHSHPRRATNRDNHGLLLTTYGFSVFGAKAGQAAIVAYVAAALLALLGIAGLIHAFRTPSTRAFAPVEQAPDGVPSPTTH
jgi:hypothetical protein